MPKIKINGKEVEAKPGDKVLKVCLDNGAFVPHYCWHAGMTPAGNCRMCILKVSNSRKLEASCMYPVADNMEVTTQGPEVEAGRKAVLEYMLINHPLDCPICDKAGECDLQDFTYDYRGGVSRFIENKVIKHTKDLGPNIRIWGNRCIVCTRCVRFCEEIAGTGEMCVINRGDHSVVDVFPGIPVDNPMSLNVVDICPVGALIDKNFMYQARVWFAKPVESVCATCSRGCNVTGTVLDNRIKRLQPRRNDAVNGHWMCDAGRLNIDYVASPRRLQEPKGTVKELATAAREIVGKHGPGSVSILASTFQTIEEMWLIKRLAVSLQAPVGWYTQTRGERWTSKSGFTIEADKTPNRAYAEKLFGPLAEPGHVLKPDLKGLISINGIPDFEYPPEVLAAAKGLEFLAVSDVLQNPLTASANVVVPSACWAEKDGTYMNKDGRIQRIRPMVDPPVAAKPEYVWLQEALVAVGAAKSALSAEGVFREAMPGLDYGKIGAAGAALNGAAK